MRKMVNVEASSQGWIGLRATDSDTKEFGKP